MKYSLSIFLSALFWLLTYSSEARSEFICHTRGSHGISLCFEISQTQNQISAMQQIDSLYVIGSGDSGLVMRTFDGGKTWEKQDYHTLLRDHNSILERGSHMGPHIESYERIVYNTKTYPNPATKEFNIVSIDVLRPVHLYDMIGREVLRGTTSDQGKLTVDVSHLSFGIYSVLLDHYGKMIPIGKLVVLGK